MYWLNRKGNSSDNFLLYSFQLFRTRSEPIFDIKIASMIHGDQMIMKMRNFPSLYQGSNSFTVQTSHHSLSDNFCSLKNSRVVRFRYIYKKVYFYFGYNQAVSDRHRADIQKSKSILIFIQPIGRKLTGNDARKDSRHLLATRKLNIIMNNRNTLKNNNLFHP